MRSAFAQVNLLLLCCCTLAGSAWAENDLAALPKLLKDTESPIAETQVRARQSVTRIVKAYFESNAPKGMRLVYQRITIKDGKVSLPGAFYLGAQEVTTREFAAFAKAKKIEADAWSKSAPELPVVWVSFEQARAYAAWKGARLPTIEELGNAATSFGRMPYPWGARFDPRALNSREGGAAGPKAPGSYPRGRSRLGLDDLLGNVSEWTTSLTGRTRRHRIFGGSWRTSLDGKRTPFQVNRMAKTARDQDVGFRLAKSLPSLPSAPAPSK